MSGGVYSDCGGSGVYTGEHCELQGPNGETWSGVNALRAGGTCAFADNGVTLSPPILADLTSGVAEGITLDVALNRFVVTQAGLYYASCNVSMLDVSFGPVTPPPGLSVGMTLRMGGSTVGTALATAPGVLIAAPTAIDIGTSGVLRCAVGTVIDIVLTGPVAPTIYNYAGWLSVTGISD